jgi:hypothetical protein
MSASARRRSNAAGAWGGSACRGKPTGRQRPALAELRIVVSVARDGRWQLSTPLAGSAGRCRCARNRRGTGGRRDAGAPDRRGAGSAPHLRVARNVACVLLAATLLLPCVLLVPVLMLPPPLHTRSTVLFSFSTYRHKPCVIACAMRFVHVGASANFLPSCVLSTGHGRVKGRWQRTRSTGRAGAALSSVLMMALVFSWKRCTPSAGRQRGKVSLARARACMCACGAAGAWGFPERF